MKKNLFTSGLLLLLLPFCFGLVACEEKAPDLLKKERDPHLIGAWTYIGNPQVEIPPKDKVIEFKVDGSCTGFNYPGGKRLYYTEGNNHLYIFVYGSGIKLSNWTYEEYYTIEGDKLYLWSSKEKMLAGKHDQAIAYERITTP